MPRLKLKQVATELNISSATAVDFLRKKGIEVEDNPNTRIEEDAYRQLQKEYGTQAAGNAGRVNTPVSHAANGNTSTRTTSASTPSSDKGDQSLTSRGIGGPKIVGKIDLNSKGQPVKQKPVAPKNDTPKVETPKTPTPSPVQKEVQVAETPKAELPKKEKAAEEESRPKPQPKVEPAKQEVSRPKTVKTETTKTETPKTETSKQAPTPEPVKAATQEEPAKEEPEIFTVGLPKNGPSINVVGKIDLSALNQSTRPRKKSKEERRNERSAGQRNGGASQQGGSAQNSQGAQNGGQQSAQTGTGDKRRRRRIGGKEKVDIEKSAQQQQQQGGNRGNRGGRGNNNGNGNGNQGGGRRNEDNKSRRDERRQPQHRPAQPEVNEEDVQKQIKETLARLTGKGKTQNKGVKWRKEKREAFANREREAALHEAEESKILKITEFVTANDLAMMMNVPINNVIATCMNLGVMVSINQRLDAETINIVADEFGFSTEYVSAEVSEAISQEEDREEDLQARPPVVTVMGHVDHGKTSLLDYIRNANVIAGEAGGITQHIGAYNVKLDDGRVITFLDTPGHEAFTAMRARGAKMTDVCIIIVAADDNVMPQTVEAINHASAAGVPIVFAINKIDKPAANPEKIKEELANMNYLVEDWGGKYQSQDISAKKGIGVNELMEKVLLEAEMLELKANPDRNATGSIIEASLDKGRGYLATVLVQNGTLRIGDIILAGKHYGKVKAMFNERNQRIKEAGPGTPAVVLGLNGAPTAGDTFNVLDTDQEAREIANKREQLQRELGLRTKKILTLEDIGRRRAIGNFQELNIIVKGDVDGSIEALSDSLIKLSTESIQVNVLHKAVGEISESDVTLAAASDAIIIGFQVRPSQAARREAEREGVEIRLYSVIYQALEEVKDAMEGMLAPEVKEEVIGTAEVLQTYKISKVGTIAGCIIREGKIKRGCKVRLIRDGIVRYTGELGSLKRMKDDVKEVTSGYDCGMSIAGYNDIQEGDVIEGFEQVEVKATLG